MSLATATAVPAASATVAPATVAPATKPLWRVGARAGVVASVAVTVVAAVALAAGVPLEVDGQAIVLPAFAQLTLMATAHGVQPAKPVQRWSARPERAFVVATVALTALSIVPDVTTPDITTASRLVLAATHVVAAAVVVPALARRLAQR